MLVKAYGCAVFGIEATIVTVEVNISNGVNFFLVGLPDSAVKESQQRIQAALKNNGYKIVDMDICPNLPLTITRNDATAIAHPDDKRIFVDKYTPASSFTGGIRLPGAVLSEEIAYTMSGGNTKRMDYYTWIGTGVYVVVPAGVNVSLS